MAQQQRLLRLLIHGLLALSSFLLLSGWIRSGVPWSETLGVRAKVQAFAETKDEYDAIYIGSSRVFRAFRPDVIDPVISQRGKPFRSYNLGIPGMWSFESDRLLDEIIAMRPARLNWVLVETPIWKADLFSPLRKITERSVRWHTPALTAHAMRSIALEDHPFEEKLRVGWRHLTQMAMRSGNHSLGPSWWRSKFGLETPGFEVSVRDYRESRGYSALESFDVPGTGERRRFFLRDQAAYLEAVQVLSDAQERGGETGGDGPGISMPGQTEAAGNSLAFENYNVAALRRQRARLSARNLNLAYIVLPELTPGRLFVDLHRRGELPLLFDYKQPSRYPDFYTIEGHFDFWHMSEAGAQRFSRLFARDFLAVISAGAGGSES